jgi:hypothetical protein
MKSDVLMFQTCILTNFSAPTFTFSSPRTNSFSRALAAGSNSTDAVQSGQSRLLHINRSIDRIFCEIFYLIQLSMLHRDCFASCGEDGAKSWMFSSPMLTCKIFSFTLVKGTVVLWRMQSLLGDSNSSCDPTDDHVIMRHIPHMSDVKDVRWECVRVISAALSSWHPNNATTVFALMRSGYWPAAAGASTTISPRSFRVLYIIGGLMFFWRQQRTKRSNRSS